MLVIIVVILSVVGLGFFQYKQLETGAVTSSSLSALSTAFSASLSSADADTAEINELLALLGQVSVLDRFNTELFDRPDYVILKDFSVTLFPAKTVGRKNPFLGIDENAVTKLPDNTASATAKSSSVTEKADGTVLSSGSQSSDTLPANSLIEQPFSNTTSSDTVQSSVISTDPAALFSQSQSQATVSPSVSTSSEPQVTSQASSELKLGTSGAVCLSNYQGTEALDLPSEIVAALDFNC